MNWLIRRSFVAAAIGATAPALWIPDARAESPAPAASSTEEERTGGLEEIVVTARKREETLQVAPVAVSAITGANLEKQQLTRIDDLAQVGPSLNICREAGFANAVTSV